MVNLEKLPFPSPGASGADFRVSSDTEYIFQCTVCNMRVRLRLGWDLRGPVAIKPKLEPSLQEAVEQLMGKVAVPFQDWYEFDCVQCGTCNTKYILQERWQETSNSAYRVQITDIARML